MPLLRVETTPTAAMLIGVLGTMFKDPCRSDYLSDTAFHTPDEFLRAHGQSIVACLAYMNDDPAALLWLSKIAYTQEMTPLHASLDIYVFPAWRSRDISPPCATMLMEGLRAYRLAQLRSIVRADNLPAQNGLHACGFTLVATLPAWDRYDGVWCDVVLYDYRMETR